jgi:hypothetical protein
LSNIDSSHRGFDLIQAVGPYRQGLIILSDDPHALLTWREESAQDLYVELTPRRHDAWGAGL